MKLSKEQIGAVDKALFDMGIKFLDIRIEMTDHAATAIEEMEGHSFEKRLKKYILENKKELLKNYSQFSTNATIKGIKLLFSNMLSLRFAGILAFSYALLYAGYYYEGLEELSSSFLVFCMLGMVMVFIIVGLVRIVKSNKLYSTAERLLAGIGGIPLLTFAPLRKIVEERAAYESLVVLYYAFILSFFVMVLVTYRFLNKHYRHKYKMS